MRMFFIIGVAFFLCMNLVRAISGALNGLELFWAWFTVLSEITLTTVLIWKKDLV